MAPHDFKRYPELTNSQMGFFYFDSPHQQIAEDFDAKVVRVIDGDTIRVEVSFRDFDFPIRFSNILAAETNEEGGLRSKARLKELIEGEMVEIIVNKNNRVEKWGRLLGEVRHKGFDIGKQMIEEGFAINIDEEPTGIMELLIMDII